ncbi:hypothetical protein B0H13DRAFT_2033271 [Mycena leptocephala]|nr:hypothetical protein B0H13DRAFT_2033271 [Mycena leptocephala]
MRTRVLAPMPLRQGPTSVPPLRRRTEPLRSLRRSSISRLRLSPPRLPFLCPARSHAVPTAATAAPPCAADPRALALHVALAAADAPHAADAAHAVHAHVRGAATHVAPQRVRSTAVRLRPRPVVHAASAATAMPPCDPWPPRFHAVWRRGFRPRREHRVLPPRAARLRVDAPLADARANWPSAQARARIQPSRVALG